MAHNAMFHDMSIFKNLKGSFTIQEVAKHNKEGDIWVSVNGLVLNLSKFLTEHPGGPEVLKAFAGKDATNEFNTIHPPHVLEAFAHDRVIGTLKSFQAQSVRQGLLPKKKNEEPKRAKPNHVMAWIWAIWEMAYFLIMHIALTVFTAKVFVIQKDRTALTRSAMFLIFFVVIHGVGNVHIFKGPDDFNGYGYFLDKVGKFWYILPVSVVELYLLIDALAHISVGLKRASGKAFVTGNCGGFVDMLVTGQLNMAVTGLFILIFFMKHLTDFRFGDVQQFGCYHIHPPTYGINFDGLAKGDLFWGYDKSIPKDCTRDIYQLEYQVLSKWYNVVFYVFSVFVFMAHACMGWRNASKIQGNFTKMFQPRVRILGYLLIVGTGLIYLSMPLYINTTFAFPGENCDINRHVPGCNESLAGETWNGSMWVVTTPAPATTSTSAPALVTLL